MKRTDENHSFNIHIATLLKHTEKAILLKEFYGWIFINSKKEHNIRHGIAWSYMAADDLADKFPYMASKSIARWLKELERDGWLYSGNFNKKKYDRTKWYTINSKRYDDAILKNLHCISQIEKWKTQIEQWIDQNEQSKTQIEEPIPSPKTSPKTSPINNSGDKSPVPSSKKEIQFIKPIQEEKKEKVAPKRKKKFVPPTLEQVLEYCDTRQVNRKFAEAWLDYQVNVDWKTRGGKGVKIKDWQAAFRASMRQDWNQKYKLSVPNVNGKKFVHANYEKYLK